MVDSEEIIGKLKKLFEDTESINGKNVGRLENMRKEDKASNDFLSLDSPQGTAEESKKKRSFFGWLFGRNK
ncbi:MAG: hypothetical protein LBI29_04270 [Rickettsiales bacterium]|jgi:hypothetical protein|nr:hypothetical protein [Rickettsiales bacterium]